MGTTLSISSGIILHPALFVGHLLPDIGGRCAPVKGYSRHATVYVNGGSVPAVLQVCDRRRIINRRLREPVSSTRGEFLVREEDVREEDSSPRDLLEEPLIEFPQ